MNSKRKTRSHKRPVNVTLDSDLVVRARALTPNLSRTVETLLREYVTRAEQGRFCGSVDIEREIATWNRFADQHGSVSDEHSTH